jgi:hypothetical protein
MLLLSEFPQKFLTNPLKPKIYLCKIPTVITETLILSEMVFQYIELKIFIKRLIHWTQKKPGMLNLCNDSDLAGGL